MGSTIQSRTWLKNNTVGQEENPGMTNLLLMFTACSLFFSGRKPHAGVGVRLGSHRRRAIAVLLGNRDFVYRKCSKK